MDNEKIRLQKYLANQGVASRRAVEKMIVEGRIRINDMPVDTMGVKIDPQKDRLTIDGLPLDTAAPRRRYILLFKPAGYICSAHDERERRTVLDLLHGVEERVYPVGRLDYLTSGLLLLTNDGELTHKLLHPSHQVQKTYLAEVEGVPDKQVLERLQQGIRLADGLTAPAEARLLKRKEAGALLEIKIHEGRNRQVRRMLEAVGYPVKHLRRAAVAFLDLNGLKPGQWRELNGEEIRRLKELS